ASVDVTNPHDVILSASVTDVPNGVATLIITATDDAGNVNSSTLQVTVDSSPVVITVSPASTTINATESLPFSAVVVDQYGQTIDVPLTWAVTPTSAGLIDANGNFTADASASGTAVIRVTPDDNTSIHAEATVTILPLVPASVNITDKPAGDLEVSDTFLFRYAVIDQLGNPFVTNVTWSSSNTTVGTIDSAGKFTTNVPGSTLITVICDDNTSVTDTATVNVVSLIPRNITISPVVYSLTVTQNVTFTATVTDKNGNIMIGAPVSWAVTPASAGVIDANGTFTADASASGTAVIRVTPDDNTSIHAEATVTINPLTSASVNITAKPSANLEVLDTFQFTSAVIDQLGNPFVTNVTWSSSNTTVGTIDPSGNFTANVLGSTLITVTCDDNTSVTDTATVNVVSLIPRNITVTPTTTTITATQNVTFIANVTDKNGNTISGAPVNWTVTPASAGVIDANGTFTADASASGTAVIRVTPDDNTSIHAEATVTILSLVPASVNITDKPAANLEVLDTFQFTSAVKDQLGNPFVTNVTWSSSNTTVGTIDPSGNFTANVPGSTLITVTCDDNTSVTDTATVTVDDVFPCNITITPTVYSLTATENVTFTATVTDKNGQTIVGAPVSWTLTPSTAGLIDSSGKFTADASASGTAVIRVTPDDNTSIHAEATVTINPLTSASVNITDKPAGDLEVSDTFQFTSAVKDQLGNPFVTNVTWSSSNTTVGTIDSAGKFTATALGSTLITVICDDNTSVTDTATVNVVSLIPRNITVSPAVYSLTVTQNVTFTATVTDKNGNIMIGAPVSWAVTPASAGVIDANGTFTADASASGTAVIRVTPDDNTSIHAEATVTINPLTSASVNITAKPSANLEVLDTFQFTSAVKDQLGNPFVTNVTWSSSNTTVGTIDSAGKFTATA
ncbi:MAG: Ig-like domain-containing protein, partial [Acholeplasmataceae bacterium]|nr:Ig-like domain-containing protein [Acholeplasmataceae bacterium]